MTKPDKEAKPYDWHQPVSMRTVCKCGAEHFAWAHPVRTDTRSTLEVGSWFARSFARDGWLVISGEPACPACAEKCADTPMVRAARREREALQMVRVE